MSGKIIEDIWDCCCEGSKLHSIYLTVGIVEHRKNMSRYDPVLLNTQRLRIGHSCLTHSYLLCGDDPHLSVLRTSSYSETRISGMYQRAGHS